MTRVLLRDRHSGEWRRGSTRVLAFCRSQGETGQRVCGLMRLVVFSFVAERSGVVVGMES